jgi:hypothetical protein
MKENPDLPTAVLMFEQNLRDRSSLKKGFENLFGIRYDTYLEGVSLAATQYHHNLTDAFDKNYEIQSAAITKHNELIEFTNDLFNDKTTSDVFSTKNICSEQPNTIAQLQTVLDERTLNPKVIPNI